MGIAGCVFKFVLGAGLCHLANIAWRTQSVLHFDKERETITGNAAAAQLMGRAYRKGFELPEIA